MIDLATEELLSLAEAAKKARVSYETINAWVRYGFGGRANPGGPKLEILRTGARTRRTSIEAVQRFLAAVNKGRANAAR